ATGLFFRKICPRSHANDGNIRFHQGAFPAVIATVGSAPSSALITLAFSEFHCPRMRGLQGITVCMSIEPRLEALLVDRQPHHLRSSAQFAEGFHYLSHGRKNEFVHRLGFSFAGIRVEVHPPSIRTKDKHLCFRHRVFRCNARLRDEKWSFLITRPKIQDLRVAIIVCDGSHKTSWVSGCAGT